MKSNYRYNKLLHAIVFIQSNNLQKNYSVESHLFTVFLMIQLFHNNNVCLAPSDFPSMSVYLEKVE